VNAAETVDRIHRRTARVAEQNDRLIERSAKQLADVRTREAKRAANDFIRELERMRRAERASGGGGGGDNFGAQFSTIAGGRFAFAGGGALAGVGAAAAGFTAAARAGVEYKSTLDKLNRSFETLLGNQRAAASHLAELRGFAERTPFEFVEVARASQRFQAMGIEAQKVLPLLHDMGNAVASIGGGKDELDRVALAIAQVNAKGRVMTQEMNQLSEVGISGWKALQAETGKSREELVKMVEAGEVSAETFNAAFHRMYGSSNAMQKQMETLSGATSTLKDKGRELLADGFTPLHGMLRDITVELARMTTEGWNAERAFKALASTIRNANNFTTPGGMGDQWLIMAAEASGVPGAGALMAQLLRGRQPPAGMWGTPSAGWGAVEPPEHLRYQPRITDADIQKQASERFLKGKEDFVTEALRRQEEAQKNARQETERQSDILKRISQDYEEASRRVSGFSGNALQLEASLYKLSIGYHTLSEANQKLAQDEINRLFSAKREEERLEAADALQKTLNATIDDAQEALRREKTHVEEVNDALGKFVDSGAKADETLRKLTVRALGFAQQMDDLAAFEAFNRQIQALADFPSESLLRPNTAVGTAQGPTFGSGGIRATEDYWKTYRESWRESLEYMREDGVEIFSDFFARIGEGWRSAVGGLALDFTRALNEMAAQAAASAVWSGILNLIGKSALGGLFGGVGGGGLGSAAGGSVNSFIGGFASGTPSAPPGLHWVGERGPELMAFRGGEQVFSNHQSKRMLGGQTVNNYYTITAPVDRGRQYVQPRSRREFAETITAVLRTRI